MALVGITSALISAWLTDTKSTPSTTFTVGDVEFEWSGSTITTDSIIVPGDNLIAETFSLLNSSNIDTEIRVEIITTYTLEGSQEAIAANDLFEPITLEAGWTRNGNLWTYDSTILPTTTSVEVISTLMLNGSLVGNSYTGAEFKVIFKFEAKQKANVTWEELGTAEIDFGSGI